MLSNPRAAGCRFCAGSEPVSGHVCLSRSATRGPGIRDLEAISKGATRQLARLSSAFWQPAACGCLSDDSSPGRELGPAG